MGVKLLANYLIVPVNRLLLGGDKVPADRLTNLDQKSLNRKWVETSIMRDLLSPGLSANGNANGNMLICTISISIDL
jgi:hypothetical protein